MIYVWYDSCSGGDGSNGSNTFLFFDDFNDGTYTDKWIPTGTVVESGGLLNLSGCHYSTVDSLARVAPPVIMETRVRRVSGHDILTRLMNESSEDRVGFGTRYWGAYFALHKGGPYFGDQDLALDAANNNWKEYRAILDGATLHVYRGSQLDVWERDDSLALDGSSDGLTMYVQLFSHEGGCSTGEWDWIRVRKYSEVEPEATLLSFLLFLPQAIHE